MDELAGILLDGTKPIVPVVRLEAVKTSSIMDAIYQATQTGKKIALHL
jgi:hypothetical protein